MEKEKQVHICFSHYYIKIKVDSHDSLLIGKRFTLHNVMILIKSVLNKDKGHYYYMYFSRNARIN